MYVCVYIYIFIFYNPPTSHQPTNHQQGVEHGHCSPIFLFCCHKDLNMEIEFLNSMYMDLPVETVIFHSYPLVTLHSLAMENHYLFLIGKS